MKLYPIDKKWFVDKWLSNLETPDQNDREFAEALVNLINRAYDAGVADGKEAAACTQ